LLADAREPLIDGRAHRREAHELSEAPILRGLDHFIHADARKSGVLRCLGVDVRRQAEVDDEERVRRGLCEALNGLRIEHGLGAAGGDDQARDIARLRTERFERNGLAPHGAREILSHFHRAVHDEELCARLVQQFARPAGHRRNAEDGDDATWGRCADRRRRARHFSTNAAIRGRVGRCATAQMQQHAI
jgi:hypothetical protein